MHAFVSIVGLLFLLTLISAGPIHRPDNVIRHVGQPQKRYVVNKLSVTRESLKRRQAPTDPVNQQAASQTTPSINPFAAPTGSGKENGAVPAVGVGGDNTSLISLLTQTTIALATQAVAPSETVTAAAESSAAEQTAATEGSTPSGPEAVGSGTAIQPNAAQTAAQTSGQEAPTSTVTVQAQTTIVETVLVTAQVTAAASTTSSDAVAEASPSSDAGAGDQGEQQPAGSVTTVFVTASPTFTGPTAGYTTLTPDANGNAASTAAAQEPAPASSISPSSLGAVQPATDTATLPSSSLPAPASEATPTSSVDTGAVTASSATAPSATPAAATTTSTTDGLAVIPVTPDATPAQAQATVTETVTMTMTVTAR
ncbi:hypothetical protein Z517_11585 [Fonsecaea pedrosoi CBS 271.37]|uniref:Uncharacterized protein n=1 Tax=Fonsecaea pedrosoi CBS 271.37 TaxID=1442368 RepID=A0A0D2G7T8_9EURO|nr:uncharacterized protein Z517_11585 [Fonsecaea pedrosoi CBS 271.37]KIW74815.1 hypothetical protein Z517_11585 [Fonsecaea pedrosoi CBS 271.37]